jgi:hypothetical protein
VSDRDPRFASEFWEAVFKKTGTSLNMSTANHPQTDGQTERANRTIEEILRAYVAPRQDDWDTHLANVEFAYNDSVNATTGFTPFFLLHGFHPRTPLAMLTEEAPNTGDESADDFIIRMQTDLTRAKRAIAAAQERQKAQADKHRRDKTFEVGDKVYLSADHLRVPGAVDAKKKFGKRAYGPFRIKRVLSPLTYELELPPTVKIHPVVHISHLREHLESGLFPDRDEEYAPPPPDWIDGEAHFAIDAFLDIRQYRGARQILCNFEGYGPEAREWLSEQRLREDMDEEGFRELNDALETRMALVANQRRQPRVAPRHQARAAPVRRAPAPPQRRNARVMQRQPVNAPLRRETASERRVPARDVEPRRRSPRLQ